MLQLIFFINCLRRVNEFTEENLFTDRWCSNKLISTCRFNVCSKKYIIMTHDTVLFLAYQLWMPKTSYEVNLQKKLIRKFDSKDYKPSLIWISKNHHIHTRANISLVMYHSQWLTLRCIKNQSISTFLKLIFIL